MGGFCKLNMNMDMNLIRCGFPSTFTPNSSSSSSSSSSFFRCKELDYGSARLSFTIGFDDTEMLHKDTARTHACLSSMSQTVDNDYLNFEMLLNKGSSKQLHNMINDTRLSDIDTSLYVRGVQACSTSHFHLLMENVNLLEDCVSDSELLKLEKDILAQLGRLGALQLFRACFSRTIYMSDLPVQVSVGSDASDRSPGTDNDLTKKIIFSKRKAERKSRQQNRLQAISKKCACGSESSEDNFMRHVVSSAAKQAKVGSSRAMIAKNEAELSSGIKVVAHLEKVKATLDKETGRTVSLKCWAVAAGVNEKVLQHDLQFGWYCRDELLKSGRSLVLFLARYYRGQGVAHEDLIQAGNIGIVQGAERFDHTRGYKLSTYVQYWIRKAMSQLVSRHGREIKVPLTLSATMKHVRKARKALKRSLGKCPDDVEVSKFTGLSLNRIKSADKCLRVVGSLDKKVGDCINIKHLECTPDTSLEMPEKTLKKQHMRNDVHKLLQDLDPKERRIIFLRYGLGGRKMSLDEVGKIYDVSKEWIRRMEKRALTKLKNDDNHNGLMHYLDLC